MSHGTPNRANDLQNYFHLRLTRYIGGGNTTYFGHLRSLLSLSFPSHEKAEQIIHDFKAFHQVVPRPRIAPINICSPFYQGRNPYVLRMIQELTPIREVLAGAFIHGSLGTYEEINYSDFDALIILKDELFSNRHRLSSIVQKLIALERIMIEFDPLQHHSWFILVETDLKFYCEAYFPLQLFEHTKSLLPNGNSNLAIYPRESRTELREAFWDLSQSVLFKIREGKRVADLFQLKALLSQIMLLPALYLQTKNGYGIFKKNSFPLAEKDFCEEDWKIMNEVSTIRKNWNYHPTWFTRMLIRMPRTWRKLSIRFFAPSIPIEIQHHLTKDFYSALVRLIQLMQDRAR